MIIIKVRNLEQLGILQKYKAKNISPFWGQNKGFKIPGSVLYIQEKAKNTVY